MGKKFDIEAVAKAIDAGEALPDLRQALKQAQVGAGRVTTPVNILPALKDGEDVKILETSQ